MITDAFSHNTATFKWIDYTWRKCQNVFCSRFTLKNIYWSQIPSMINGFQLLTRKWKIVNNLLHKCLALQCAVGEISDLHESGSDIFYLTCDVIWWLYNNWKNSNIELFNRSICIFWNSRWCKHQDSLVLFLDFLFIFYWLQLLHFPLITYTMCHTIFVIFVVIVVIIAVISLFWLGKKFTHLWHRKY